MLFRSQARRDNVVVTVHLAQLCQNIPFIFLSSGEVFDGKTGWYSEMKGIFWHSCARCTVTTTLSRRAWAGSCSQAFVRLSAAQWIRRSGFNARIRASTFEVSVSSSSARDSPWTSQAGAHREAVFTTYCPISPAAPVMTARGAMVSHSLTRQLPVFNPVRLIGFLAEPSFSICVVLAVVPFVPDHLAVAFERHDVGRDPV